MKLFWTFFWRRWWTSSVEGLWSVLYVADKLFWVPRKKKGGYAWHLTFRHVGYTAERGDLAWWVVTLFVWPCWCTGIKISMSQYFLLQLKSVSAALDIQKTASRLNTVPAGQLNSIISYKCFHWTNKVFIKLWEISILCRDCFSGGSLLSGFCHSPAGQQETLLHLLEVLARMMHITVG